MKKIKLVLADRNESSRLSIRNLLELDDGIDIVGEAGSGKEVMELIETIEPQVVVTDVNLDGMDGLETARQISINYPRISVIMLSLTDDLETVKKAMLAGAREYLVKPLSPGQLHRTVRQVAALNEKVITPEEKAEIETSLKPEGKSKQLITIFGTKGGVGRSVVCSNLAVAAAREYKNQVGLVDLDIQFGDISLMLNLSPRKTISELMQEGDRPSLQILEEYLYERHGVQILAAPNRPELAELVNPAGVQNILELCRMMFKYTFIDTPAFIDDTTLTALEISDLILLIVSLDLPTIKNVKKGIEILRSLNLLERTRLILNRSSGVAGIEPDDVERVLDMAIEAEVPSDGKLVVTSLNQGVPFVKMNPRSPISKGISSVLKVVQEG